MGHSTRINDLLCTAVILCIYHYHIIDQETPFMFTNFSLDHNLTPQSETLIMSEGSLWQADTDV